MLREAGFERIAEAVERASPSSHAARERRPPPAIPGSHFEPWHDIDELPEGLDPERPVAVMCASGQRAAVAASLVQRFGAQRVLHVVNGGVPKWGRLGHPIEAPPHTEGPEEEEPSATSA